MRIRACRGLVVLFLFGLLPVAAWGQQHARRGTVLGGLTGAIAGAAIGNENDEPVAGAAIGATLGAITGNLLGDSVDRSEAQARWVQQQRFQQQSRGVTALDVLSMKQNGVNDAVIINHIRANGVRQRLEISDVITLHQQGLSDAVITAMQQAAPATGPRPTVVRPSPVFVERHHYVAPPVVRHCYGPHYYHHPHGHHAHGWSLQIRR